MNLEVFMNDSSWKGIDECMYFSKKLNYDQIKALYEYITDGHVVINSGRQTGKTITLKAIFKFWLTCQMKDEDRCVIISRSRRANEEFINGLFSMLYGCKAKRMDGMTYKLFYNNKMCYIELHTSLRNYWLTCDYGLVMPSLIIGDEQYIPDDTCMRTACAFTQNRKFVNLPPLIDKDELRKMKAGMGNEFFDLQIGQYLPDGWLDE